MYNSRTNITNAFAPLRCPKTSRFPHHPLVVAVSKNSSGFISMCLRSVHSLHSLRFGGGSSCLTTRPPFTTLRSVHFTHLSTAQHKWLLHSTAQISPHSISLCGCFYPPMLIPCISYRVSTINPIKHPAKLHSISTH